MEAGKLEEFSSGWLRRYRNAHWRLTVVLCKLDLCSARTLWSMDDEIQQRVQRLGEQYTSKGVGYHSGTDQEISLET